MSAEVVKRPSDARRAALREATKNMGEKGVPIVSNFFPLDRYYDAAEQVLAAFHRAYDERRLDDAYVYGKRFAIFSLEALPRHNYYKSPRYVNSRSKNGNDMADVILKLEKVAELMDREEIEKEKERKRLEAEIRRREEQRLLREAEAARLRLMQFQSEVDHKRRQDTGSQNVKQSALDKLRMLNGGPVEKPLNNSLSAANLENGADDPYLQDLKRSFRREGQGSLRSLGNLGSTSEDGEASGRYPRRGSNDSRSGQSESRSSGDGERFRRRLSTGSQGSKGRRTQRNLYDDGCRKPERRMSGDQPLPPPMAPPPSSEAFPPPPSYDSLLEKRRHSQPTPNKFPPSVLEQAAANAAAAAGGATTHLSPGVRDPFPPSQGHSGPIFANRELEKKHRSSRKEKVPFRVQKEKARKQYQDLITAKRITVIGIPTHQGRMRSSTNGCAVISPLVVSHHLRSGTTVEDQEIVHVIDKECGPLLREIRSKLGLEGDALIIPSDVHDHLVDKKILKQDAFVGATGGNIMDRKHLAEFLKLLESGENNSHRDKRTGAALFFREHVVSIVKVSLGGGRWCYDLIDSLPSPSTGRATRTRCFDLAAFEAYVRYYCSSKFSESNCNYIDKNDWNDTMADFDPRVFQGFIWGDP